MSTSVHQSRFAFGLYEMDLQAGELWKAGFRVKLQSQPFKVLAALVQRPGQIVTREELQAKLWGRDTVVDFDHALGTAINKIREALGDSADNPRFVETLARRGYRFIAPVTVLPGEPTPEPAQTALPALSSPAPAISAPASASAETLPAGDGEAGRSAPVEPLAFPVPATVLKRRRRLRAEQRMLVTLGATLLLFLAVASLSYWAGRRGVASVPRHIVRVTHQGNIEPSVVTMESLAPAATDGVHLYTTLFENGRGKLAAITPSDGSVSPLDVPDEVAGPALGDISPDGSHLLLRDHLSPESEQPLWVVPTSGGSALRVGNVQAHDATWMPDGASVLFANGNRLYTVALSGGGPSSFAVLPGRAFWLRWSPDGKLLRFTIIDPLRHTLTLWQLRGQDKQPQQILQNFTRPASECCGVWTADGRWFVFQSSRAGHTDLWQLAGSDLAHPERVTDGPLDFQAPLPARTGHRIYFLGADARSELERVSPKGELAVEHGFQEDAVRLEYTRDKRWVCWTDLVGHLWRARADGTEKLQLTPGDLDVFLARWSPDGARLAVMAREAGRAWQIYLVGADGTDLRPVLKEERNAADPSWSSDGASLVFGRTNDRMGEETSRSLELLNLQTGEVRPVPNSEGLFSPRWSPDGRFIVALSLDQRRVQLFDVEKQTWQGISVPSGADPVWTADSRTLYIHASLSLQQPIYRVSVPGGQVQQVIQLGQTSGTNAVDYVFSGLAVDGTPLIRTRTTSGDIFYTDLDR